MEFVVSIGPYIVPFFIGILYGTRMYSWTIVAYLFAFVFGGILVKQINRLLRFKDLPN